MQHPWPFWIIASIHLLAGAAWFGAMFYSLTVLHPRAKKFFNDEDQFEFFIASISQGARWKVLSALGLIGGSGAALIFFRPTHITRAWIILIAIKIIAFVIALVVFWIASWKLWPKRIFATKEELPGIRRKFLAVGITLICIAGASMALGLLAHLLR